MRDVHHGVHGGRYCRGVHPTPAAAPTVPQLTAADPSDDTLLDACGEDPSFICERVYEASSTAWLAEAVEWVIDGPLTIFAILIVAMIVVRVCRRAVDRLVRRVIYSDSNTRWLLLPDAVTNLDSDIDREKADRVRVRRHARASSLSHVLRGTISVVVWTIALMLVLSELGINLAPLIAGAGIAGVALGFGAQALVNDCISGFFMLLEDQYGIGDVVDLGEAVGTVEEVALRATVLRGIDGTVWHVPNGEVKRVGNKSQHWSTALIDIDVAYDADLTTVRDVMQQTAEEVCERASLSELILDAPHVLGVETLGADGITVRMAVTTAPGAQWDVQRQLREALKSAFDAAGIDIPFPQRTVWLQNQDS